jgi:hypothetical protein
MKCIRERILTENIALHLLLDIGNFYSKDSINAIRYSNETLNDQIYLDVSFDNVGLEGTEKFILQSSGEILDKDSFIVFNPCALKPRKKLTPLPLTNF